ncbi:zinc ribbon domain-containing protein [Streptomyces sp. TRM 70361]|uniref:zinc ribbon domain-containing protein n=1 Tax=Streptomyces sp. TRM 70361 TaxID=3116553 RepID=UPI003FCC9617
MDARNTPPGLRPGGTPTRTCPPGLGGCGRVDGKSRATQARFQCTACGFAANADHVGAANVLNRAGLALCAAA